LFSCTYAYSHQSKTFDNEFPFANEIFAKIINVAYLNAGKSDEAAREEVSSKKVITGAMMGLIFVVVRFSVIVFSDLVICLTSLG
jgi:hypothetical protein